MSSIQLSQRLPWLGVIVAGILMLVGGQFHPRVDISLDFDAAVGGMLADPLWREGHIITLVGLVVLGVALFAILRSGSLSPNRNVALIGLLALVGTLLRSVEMVPHIFQNLETAEVLTGGSTPINDFHLILQAFTNPVFGIGIAALSVVGARTRTLGHWIVSPLGVLGGIAFAIAGPAVLITKQPEFALLFLGAVGIALWFTLAGIRSAWRPPTS